MPLDRAHITSASAVMLPWYVVTDATFGVLFIIDPGDRFAGAPSLAAARGLLPLPAWGGLWFALAAVMVAAAVSRSRDRMILALWISGITWGLWGFVTAAAILTQPLVTPLAGWLGWTLAAAHYASIRSLRRSEV